MIITEEVLKQARMGSYQELAWILKFDLKSDLSAGERQLLLAETVSFADKNQLGLAGELGDFVVLSTANRKAVTAEEQQVMRDWLTKRPEIIVVHENDGDGYSDAWLEQVLHWGEWQTDTFTKFFS